MARRVIMMLPLPADVEDLVQVLTDVSRSWAATRVDVTNDPDVLNVTASRRRAQRPAPDEEPDDEEIMVGVNPARFAPPAVVGFDIEGASVPKPVVPERAEPPLSGQVIPADPDEPLDPHADQRPGRWDDLPNTEVEATSTANGSLALVE